MEAEENIKVLVRIRPNDDDDSDNLSKYKESNSINIPGRHGNKCFSYDKVADKSTSQEEMFESCKNIFLSFFSGYNSTLFAYGQTSSGKTHTMTGNASNPGLIPQGLQFIFDKILEAKQSNVEYLIKCSFIEIYNEMLFDLLDPKCKRVYLKVNLSQGYYVENSTEKIIENTRQALQILQIGLANRHVASTSMNHESSRSHSVFTIVLECCETIDGVKNIRKSVLHMVDLAGSERQKNTNSEGTVLKESCSINRSLHILGQVISALVDINNGKDRFVQYADSKLTRLLKDSIGGNSKTLLVACIHPNIKYTNDTISTLQFASNVKKIKNKATVNIDVSGSVESLQREVVKLREQLKKTFNLSIQPDNIKLDSLWHKRFLNAMALRANLIDENCQLREQLILQQNKNKREENENDANIFVNENKRLSKLKILQLNKTKSVETLLESEVVDALYKEYNDLIGKNSQEQTLNSLCESIEMARLREELMEVNIKLIQLQDENAAKEIIHKDEKRKLELENASLRKMVYENDKEKEQIAVKRRQTLLMKNKPLLPIENIIGINCQPRNLKCKGMPKLEEIGSTPETFEASDELTIDSLTSDLKEAENKNKEFARNIGKLEYEIKEKEKEINELKKNIEEKEKLEINYKELKEKFKSMEIELETSIESVRNCEIQIKNLTLEKAKSNKTLNEKISNMAIELEEALSERDSLKNELEVVKMSLDVLSREIQEKSDSCSKLAIDKEKDQQQIENISRQLTESRQSINELFEKENDYEEEIENLKAQIIDLNNCVSLEKSQREKILANQLEHLENIENLENIIKQHQSEIADLTKSLEKSKNYLKENEEKIKELKKDNEIRSKIHLTEQKSLESLIGKLENENLELERNLEIEKTNYQNINCIVENILIRANCQSNISLVEGVKNLGNYINSQNDYIQRLSKELIDSNEQRKHCKKEYEKLNNNSKQKLKSMDKLENNLYTLRIDNIDLSTQIAKIKMVLKKCDQKTRDMIMKEIDLN